MPVGKTHSTLAAIGLGTLSAFPAFSATTPSILCSVETCTIEALCMSGASCQPTSCLDGSFLLEVSIQENVMTMESVAPIARERVFFGQLAVSEELTSEDKYRAMQLSEDNLEVAALRVYDNWKDGEFVLTEQSLVSPFETTIIAGSCKEDQ